MRRIRLGVGFSHDNDDVGMQAIGDKSFLPIDNIAVAIPDRCRTNSGKIGTGTGLCHGNGRDDIAGNAARKPFFFLGFIAETAEVGRDDIAVQMRPETVCPGMEHFLYNDDGIFEPDASPSVTLIDTRAKIAILAHLLPRFPGDHALFFPCIDMGHDLSG